MIPVANLAISNNAFIDYFNKCNEISGIISTQVVTANTNANGSATTGNAFVTGTLGATVIVGNSLRGGNVQTSNTLVITSNVAQQSSLTVVANASTTNTNPNQVIDSYSALTHRTSKYVLQITTASGFQATEILVVHDGANVVVTEYATLSTNGSMGTFAANLATNVVSLLFNPTVAVSTVNFERRSLTV